MISSWGNLQDDAVYIIGVSWPVTAIIFFSQSDAWDDYIAYFFCFQVFNSDFFDHGGRFFYGG
ncbi:hypothetical protein AO275_19915 [Pseudomonas viridiflava]|nr:hypothetical protein AO275_19915 [Pseudomonas viridiflava]